MSKLKENRINVLRKLRAKLGERDKTDKLTVESYLQLLDYHISLLEELDGLVDAINNGDTEKVSDWYEKRVI
jgi:hypothetical protein